MRRPPVILRILARLLVSGRNREFVLGDLDELYARRFDERGRLVAGLMALRDVFGSLALVGGLTAGFGSGGRRSVRLVEEATRSARSLVRRPVATAVITFTIAAGVGGAGAAFGIVNQVLLRPVPGVADQQNAGVVEVRSAERRSLGLSAAVVDALRETEGVQELAAFDYVLLHLNRTGHQPIATRGYTIYGRYFELLGVKPLAGRLIRGDETGRLADPNVAVISEALWTSAFQRDPGIVGRQIELNGESLQVLGVAGDFRGTDRFWPIDVWVPRSAFHTLTNYPAESGWEGHRGLLQDVLVRPVPGVSLERAEAALTATLQGLAEAEPGTLLEGARASVTAGLMPPQIGFALTGFLGGLVVLVLLIPCANVANLLLVQGLHRQGEVAVHRAMGASRWTIVRGRMIESAQLGIAGTLIGLGFAWAISQLYRGVSLSGLPELDSFTLERGTLLFAGAVLVAVTVVTGLVPALLGSRLGVAARLRDTELQSTDRHRFFRTTMPAIQMGAVLPLLVGGVMLVRGLQQTWSAELGLEPEGVYFTTLPAAMLPEGTTDYRGLWRELSDALQGTEFALASETPFARMRMSETLQIPDGEGAEALRSGIRPVGPGWFELMQMAVIAGRAFGSDDQAENAPAVAVMTAPLARRLFGSTDVVGRTVAVGRDATLTEIVGVVGDVRMDDPRDPPDEALFVPFPSRGFQANLTVHLRPGPGETPPDLERMIAAAVPYLPVPAVAPLTDRIALQLAEQSVMTRIVTLLSGLGLLITGIGLYSSLAWSVARRRREFGIRLTLGADGRGLVRLALRSAAGILIAGTLTGIAGTWFMTRGLAARIHGVPPVDALSVLLGAGILVVVALAACWIPVRRAARTDPLVSIRG